MPQTVVLGRLAVCLASAVFRAPQLASTVRSDASTVRRRRSLGAPSASQPNTTAAGIPPCGGGTRRRGGDWDHALSGHRHSQADFQDRPGHLAVRLPGMGIRGFVRRPGGARRGTARPRPGRVPLRHRRDLRVRPQRADPGPGPGRGPELGLPGHQALPAAAARPGGGAARGGQREPARRPPPGPVPGPPAEPGGPGRPGHARDAGPAAGRAGRRGGGQQLLAGPLAGRGGRARRPGPVQPGRVQPRRAGPRA